METRTVSHHEIQKIMKEVKIYKRTTDKEIKLLRVQIVKLHKMIEKSVIPEDNPDAYEIKAIKNFESKKKKGDLGFVSLDSLS
ncbi:MAG: hypothetical protein WDZ43_04175 [Nitrosopumilaceae archaeon]